MRQSLFPFSSPSVWKGSRSSLCLEIFLYGGFRKADAHTKRAAITASVRPLNSLTPSSHPPPSWLETTCKQNLRKGINIYNMFIYKPVLNTLICTHNHLKFKLRQSFIIKRWEAS